MTEIAEVEKERDYWRMVAIYFADCHAATAEYEGHLKSTSKSRRERYASICEAADKALRGSFNSIHSGRVLEEATTRCARAAAKIRETA